MRCAFGLSFFLFFAPLVHGQSVQFTRPDESNFTALSSREELLVEKRLTAYFPINSLRRKAHGSGSAIAKRVTYDVVKQRGKKFIIAVFNGCWGDYTSELWIFRLSNGSLTKLYHTRPWQGNYFGYTLNQAKFGKENLIMLREGGSEEKSFGLATIFTFSEADSSISLHDLTPKNENLTVNAKYPFRLLYGKGIRIYDFNGDVILRSGDNYASATTSDGFDRWTFDKVKRRFLPMKTLSPTIEPTITSKAN